MDADTEQAKPNRCKPGDYVYSQRNFWMVKVICNNKFQLSVSFY